MLMAPSAHILVLLVVIVVDVRRRRHTVGNRSNNQPFLRRLNPVEIGIFAVGIPVLLAFAWIMLHKKWEFANAVSVGMTEEQVVVAVGPPDIVLSPGETLSAWGDHQSVDAKKATWVYYISPKSQHRFVLEFDDAHVVRAVEHQQN